MDGELASDGLAALGHGVLIFVGMVMRCVVAGRPVAAAMNYMGMDGGMAGLRLQWLEELQGPRPVPTHSLAVVEAAGTEGGQGGPEGRAEGVG